MSSSATGVGMPICFLGTILLILTQKSSQKFGDVLGIMSYSDSLYLPDNSVKAFRQGIVDNSKLAADIGIAILFDIYGDDMKYEYPFTVAKFYSDWTIEGTLPEGVLGGVGHITLMRSDGMVSFYIHEK